MAKSNQENGEVKFDRKPELRRFVAWVSEVVDAHLGGWPRRKADNRLAEPPLPHFLLWVRTHPGTMKGRQ